MILILKLSFAFLSAFIICCMAIPAIIKVASLKNLTDAPDQERKFHKETIPTLGGIGIFAAFLISFSIMGEASSLTSYPYFVASLFMLFLVGIKDDILIISPLKKLAIQIFASIEIVVIGGVILADLNGIFGISQIAYIPSIILSTLIFVVLINSFNFIDGINGLAGGVGVIISGTLGFWFVISGFFTMAVLAFVLTGALLGFLIFNYPKASIFMGDTGAMVVGFILIYLVFQFLTLNGSNPNSAYYITNAPIFALALFIIPVVDTLRVVTIRLWNRKNPMKADYNHLHHFFIKEGMSPVLIAPLLWAWNIIIILIGYQFGYLNPNVLLILILVTGFAIKPITILIRLFKVGEHRPKSLIKFFPNYLK